MKSSVEYEPLQRLSEQDNEHYYPQQRSRWPFSKSRVAFISALVLSLLLNVFSGLKVISLSHSLGNLNTKSKFAGLEWNTISTFVHHDVYDSENKTLAEQSWKDLHHDPGSVALDNSYTKALGLPEAQPYPWDQSKGIYFLNAYHSIHCLKILRLTINQLRNNETVTYPFSHTEHCLDSQLQDTICFADDTPRYTSFQYPGSPGVGQQRLCRDWNKLVQYAEKYTACWRDIRPETGVDTLLRYRYCPPSSPYYERIHQIFGDFDMNEES